VIGLLDKSEICKPFNAAFNCNLVFINFVMIMMMMMQVGE